MKKIYVLFTILLVGLFVGCSSVPEEVASIEDEYDKLCKIVPEDMAVFIVTHCHGKYEVVNLTNGTPYVMTSKFGFFEGSLSTYNQGIFFNNSLRAAGCSHIPADRHNWSCDKNIAVKQFHYTRGFVASIAYEIKS